MPASTITRPCGVCKKPCTEPKYLPCIHPFCKTCLKFHIITVPTNRQWEGFSCPSCNTYTKAIDPDKPLMEWADQFPDTIGRKKVTRQRETSEDSVCAGTGDGNNPLPKEKQIKEKQIPSTGSSTSLGLSEDGSSPSGQRKASLGSGHPSPYSSVSDSPLLKDRQLSFGSGSQSPSHAFFQDPFSSPRTSVTELSEEIDGVTMSESPSRPGSESGTNESIPDSPGTFIHIEPDTIDTGPLNTADEPVKQTMCLVHPWKPSIVTCTKCDSIACGQCLTESHQTCKGTDFVQVSDTNTWPNMSDLEEEVRKVSPGNDSSSNAHQLNQTRTVVRQKIKQVALNLIKSIKHQEALMLKKVSDLYHDEIWRLSSGINPSETLLKEVKQLKDRTEDMSKEPTVSIVLEADEIMGKQTDILGRLKAVDFACVPPDICFVPDFEASVVTLGDLIVDQGFYPKHDVPDLPDEPSSPVLTQIVPPATAGVSVQPNSGARTPMKSTSKSGSKAGASPQERNTQQQSTPQTKSKTKSLMGRLLSPMHKTKSKFYVKVPEL